MPFTLEQFFDVFTKYNQAVFPAQFLLIWASAAAVLLAIKQKTVSDEIISGILAFLWIWAGIVYHLIFFTRINSGAYIFGVMFIAQGALFFYEGIIKKQLTFRLKPDFDGFWGMMCVIYALVIYPVIGYLLGHVFPSSPTFGLPCPTTIFTFGVLMWTDRKLALYLLIVPLLWAIIGSTAAVRFGVKEDFGLIITAVMAASFIFRRSFAPKEEVFL